MTQDANKTCQGCGGAITADQIVGRQAGLVAGVLLCPKCVDQKRQELMEARNEALKSQAAPATPTQEGASSQVIGASQGTVWIPPVTEGKDIADETLSLVSDDEVTAGGPTQIRSFSEGSTLAGVHKEEGYKRPLASHNEPATRVRTFHGKLTEAGLAHMDEQINEWLDSHPDIFIKSSASTVGTFEGKTKEPHLLVTLFY
ncbi:MAG: hypothetical protein MI923_19630 [Phycisphaerales bacterium]|nr:hypothetical protein [Phycisphaerales bacterium]